MAKENQTQNASEETVSVAPEAVALAQGTTTIVKKSGTALSLLALLVALGVGGAGFYLGQQQLEGIQQQLSSLSVTTPQTSTLAFDAKVLVPLEEANKAMQQQLSRVESQIQSKTQELAALQAQINQLAAKNQTQQPTDWLFSEADFLLNNALRKLMLDNDVETAVSLLKLADETLLKVSNSQAQEVRGAIGQDLKTLLSMDSVDQNAVMQKLSQLANSVDELPLLNVNFDTEKSDKPSDSLDDWQENVEKTANSFLNHFIRISPKHGSDRKELLAPNQDIYLRENIRLRLQLAIMAVPRQQNELYKQSLDAVASWIRSYFDTNDEATKSFLKSVDELAEQSIYVDVPDHLQSLTLLDKYLNRAPLTVQKVAIEADKDAAVTTAPSATATEVTPEAAPAKEPAAEAKE